MLAYVARRLFAGVIMLIVMSFVTFLIFYATPVDPARLTCGKNCTPQLIEQNRKALGYDKPIVVQWGEFMKGVVAGRDYPADKELAKTAPQTIEHCAAPCMGYSPYQNEEVSTELAKGFPVSLSVGLAAFVMWIVGGVLLGVLAALRRGKLVDRAIVALTLVAFAFPTFFIGRFLFKFVALKWGLTPLPTYTSIAEGGVGLWLQGLLLPGLTLALVYMAQYVRLTRAFVLETMGEDYLRTARAKGLKRFKIITKHTMRAALTPIVTMAGMDLSYIVGGTIITEAVFNYPGLGLLALQATINFDLPTTVGIVLVLAALVIVANMIVDMLYAFIDPRVRLG